MADVRNAPTGGDPLCAPDTSAVPATPDISDDVPITTTGGLTLTTKSGAALAGDMRSTDE